MNPHVREAAELLLGAYDSRQPVEPLTERWPDFSLDDAYDVQLAQVEQWVEDGDVLRGHKVGLTSVRMQRLVGVDQPDYGHLLGSMFHPEHWPIPTDAFLQPRVEPEIAFVVGRGLAGPGVTVADALRSVEFVLPALEVIDSRIRDWRITFFDTVADNASSGGLVLGAHPTAVGELDLRLVGCNLMKNGLVAATGAGGAVLGHPLLALAWVANVLGDRGIRLEPGHVVLPGSCTTALPVLPGDTVTAEFAGLGSVTARFGSAKT